MFAVLVEQIRTEAKAFTGGKKKEFFKDTTIRHRSATPEIFKWASRRKNLSGDLKVHAPQARKTGSGKDEKGSSKPR